MIICKVIGHVWATKKEEGLTGFKLMVVEETETAKENGLNPLAYLTYIFKNAPNWDIRNDANALQNLLPSFAPDDCKIKAVTD